MANPRTQMIIGRLGYPPRPALHFFDPGTGRVISTDFGGNVERVRLPTGAKSNRSIDYERVVQMKDALDTNKREYMDLMRRFLRSEIDGKTFQKTFLDMWRRDRDISYGKLQEWSRRHDVDLIEARQRGEMSNEEFSKRWRDLWGYEPTRWLEIQDSLFRDVDSFEPDQTVYEASKRDSNPYNAAYYITQEELRDRVKEYLRELEEKVS
jgi:hypothetical protein